MGEVGSGKSTLLSGILGEMPVYSLHHARCGAEVAQDQEGGRAIHATEPAREWGGPNRPHRRAGRIGEDVAAFTSWGAGEVRTKRVCYASQTPWIMSGTMRDNILFGLPMEEDHYR